MRLVTMVHPVEFAYSNPFGIVYLVLSIEKRMNITICISGRGSNMQALLEHFAWHNKANFVLVLSDTVNAPGLIIAESMGVPTAVVDKHQFSSEEFQLLLAKQLIDAQTDVVLLAGFMSIIKAPNIHLFRNQMLNIHPSLLPNYPGLNPLQRALDDNCSEVGATVHMVDQGIDSGDILRQVRLPVLANDDASSLAKRLRPLEHKLYISVLNDLLEGTIKLPDL